MTYVDDREAKLPKWAQEYLAEERRKRERAERRLDNHLKTVEKTNIWYGSDFDNPMYIPEDRGYQRVVFSFAPHRGPYDQFTVRVRDGGLEVSSGGRALQIEPIVSNVVRLQLKD